MNQANLIGRLTRDPESKVTPNGVAVCAFSIAITRDFNREETDFINIVTWRKIAENCGKYLKKGSQVGVTGRIQSRSYDGNDGKRRYVTEIVADQVEFLTPKQSDENKAYEESKAPAKEEVFGANAGEFIPVDDDNLPF